MVSFLPKEERSEVLVHHVPEVPQSAPEPVRVQQLGGLPHVQPGLSGGRAAVDRRDLVQVSPELRVCPNLGADRRDQVPVDQDQGGCRGAVVERRGPVGQDCRAAEAQHQELLQVRGEQDGCSFVGGNLREEVTAAPVGYIPCGEISIFLIMILCDKK